METGQKSIARKRNERRLPLTAFLFLSLFFFPPLLSLISLSFRFLVSVVVSDSLVSFRETLRSENMLYGVYPNQ